MIAGLPRSGSSLLVNILNSNPEFRATSTSGVIDVLRNMKSTFSHNITWKTQDRIALMEDYRKGMKGFLDGFYGNDKVVFDKCRGWSNHLTFIDAILGNSDSKIIWTYRNPVEVLSSIEAHHQKTPLIENTDESQDSGAMITLDRRIGLFINGAGIVSYPVEILKDAIEMGFRDRIHIVKYGDLTTNPKDTLDDIHKFLGEKLFDYDFDNIKQTVNEHDAFYNYKFPHSIKEGKVEYKKADINLPKKYQNIINNKFSGLNKFVFEGDSSQL